MTTLKLSERAIERAKPDPGGRQTILWDKEIPGLGVLVSGKTDAKTFIAQRRMPDGRSRRVTLGSVAGYKARKIGLDGVREEAADMLERLRKGDDPKEKRPAEATLQKALDDYIEAKSLRPDSVRLYRGMIEGARDKTGQWREGWLYKWLALPLGEISDEMVRTRHAEIRNEVASRPGKGRVKDEHRGVVTANLVMRTFGAVWNYQKKHSKGLGENPITILKGEWHKGRRRRAERINFDDLAAFHAAADKLESQPRDLVLLILYTGMRFGEAAGLRWSEIDFTQKLIRLPLERVKAGNAKQAAGDAFGLELPMSSLVFDLLVARQALGRDRSGFVFPSRARSGHMEDLGPALRAIAKTTGVMVSPHDLRRTFIDVADDSDLSDSTIKALVGHSAGGDVTEGYKRVSLPRRREAAERIAARLRALCGIEAPAGAVPLAG